MFRHYLFVFTLLIVPRLISAQSKKPLDHSVFDSWQSIGEKKISNDGKWVLYTIDLQEGDGELVIQSTDVKYRINVPRGYGGVITEDNRYAIFKIKPKYADTRQARINKKNPADFPKDSMGILELGSDSVLKIAAIKSFKTPEKGYGWVAWQLEKTPDTTRKVDNSDSLMKAVDSSKQIIPKPFEEKPGNKRKLKAASEVKKSDADFAEYNLMDAEADDTATAKIEEGTDLVLHSLQTGDRRTLKYVSEYYWSKNGKILVIENTMQKADKKTKNSVLIWRSAEDRIDTISIGGSDFRNYALDETGFQIAFVAERDSSAKAPQKFYKLWYWHNGQDSAVQLADKNMSGMQLGWTISENGNLEFSKTGKRLFFGAAPVQPVKDTSLVEIDLVKVDIWHFKDDYLQTQQLKSLEQEKKRSYLAMYDFNWKKLVQLADKNVPQIITTNEGDGDQFVGITDVGKRISMQWEGETRKDVYAINPLDGSRKLAKKDLSGNVQASSMGKYIIWYDNKLRQYFTWRDGVTKNISAKVPAKLYNEEFDMPDDPNPYGLMGWLENDSSVYVYDRYDIWELNPDGIGVPVKITKEYSARKNKITYRYVRTDPEERFLKEGESLLIRSFDNVTKKSGLGLLVLGYPNVYLYAKERSDFSFGNPLRAKDSSMYIYTRENFLLSPDLYASNRLQNETKLSSINPQQQSYNWGRAVLVTWKAYNGKQATGILYKPEDYYPKKKYPLICYFYEKLSNGLNNYIPPAPTPSRLNISFFVSRGYMVLAPDIAYSTGHPGLNAFDYVVSGARALAKRGWVDSTRMGIQGQSWGGFQVAYIITRTKLFKAAWAGAPVANMTSAYGGIRWESGLNRQFQYERTQSRIGALLWDKPQLYIENSPLFHLRKVTTPLVIMANDNDGAVPWYQGIELFTGLRRLGKQVWMLNYNGEAHNLVERKNRKDLQVREQQFFDWLLKGEKPPKWLAEGVLATEKGMDWGLEVR